MTQQHGQTGDEADVVVVGAGLAGLACAHELEQGGLMVRVLEAGDAVGGRVRTDHVDGFTLDRGFQVLNTGYPVLARLVDLDALDLRQLEPGVAIAIDGRRVTLGHPVRLPGSAASALALPVGGLGGKSALGLYAALCAAMPAGSLKRRDDMTAAEAWRRANIPSDLVNAVLRPFFSGVLLEQQLTTSRRFTDLMMRMFARGRSAVPARGMQALPSYLAGLLADGAVRLSSRVYEVGARHARVPEGAVSARAVVVATDAWTAERLLPGGFTAPPARGVTTVYHAAPPFPEATGMLLLDADRSPIANTVALSTAAPEYAPAGCVLVATSIVHDAVPADFDGPHMRAALTRLHGTDTSRWERLATYDLQRALPGMPAPHRLRRPVRLDSAGETVYVAGDHRDTSSIQGALVSGRRAARAVLTDLATGGAHR